MKKTNNDGLHTHNHLKEDSKKQINEKLNGTDKIMGKDSSYYSLQCKMDYTMSPAPEPIWIWILGANERIWYGWRRNPMGSSYGNCSHSILRF